LSVAAEVMRRRVVSAGPEDSLRRAAELMASENVGSVLVLGPGGRLLGIFTERDLARKVAARLDLDAERLGDHATREVVTAAPGEPLASVAHKMIAHGIRHLPVVDPSGRVIGVVSIRDVLRRLVGEHEFP